MTDALTVCIAAGLAAGSLALAAAVILPGRRPRQHDPRKDAPQ